LSNQLFSIDLQNITGSYYPSKKGKKDETFRTKLKARNEIRSPEKGYLIDLSPTFSNENKRDNI